MKLPRWLSPKAPDVLPLKPQQVGANLANSRGRFADLSPRERAKRLSAIGKMGAEAARTASTPEQRREWARQAAIACNRKRWGNG